jgi:predicted NodU family carbamoyl transferase
VSEIILGIADGAHDTGAALIKDGRLALAINEERLSRTKRESRSPISSVNWILDQETNIDAIAVTANPPTLLRSLKIEGKRAINSNLSIKSLLQKFYNNYRNPDENIERLAEKLSKYTAMGDKKI